jgi:hypothetical protein
MLRGGKRQGRYDQHARDHDDGPHQGIVWHDGTLLERHHDWLCLCPVQ